MGNGGEQARIKRDNLVIKRRHVDHLRLKEQKRVRYGQRVYRPKTNPVVNYIPECFDIGLGNVRLGALINRFSKVQKQMK